MLFVGASRLLRPALRSHPVTDDQLACARAAITSSRDTMANLALLGDKSLLISDSGRGFVMFQAGARSLVALGDPMAPEEEAAELAWRFHEMCDREGAWTVFYQVSSDRLPLYLDMRLKLVKLGEEARVDLSVFTLRGACAKGWRSTLNHVRREGGVFEIVPRDALRDVLPELRAVSDAWLTSKKTREKGFSLGFFSESYLENFEVAVIRREGAIVAFANLWTGADREEISPDLMRFDPRAPDGAMEALLLEIMQWGKNEGFRWFNLGSAPLAGLEPRPGGPIWNRIGAYVYRHGEHFYNFQGPRRYKQKFSPRWTPRYLAYPGGITLPRVLLDIATLSSRGLTGVIGK